ncbi:hypothetical protein ACIQPQ_37040 [Streptomyces sp. NPDC091281]|uniref:hypothetical protein n=1 Tax=Streptomyces sp. NPDC091281 TaxID=3365985 RepID=UPI00382E464D
MCMWDALFFEGGRTEMELPGVGECRWGSYVTGQSFFNNSQQWAVAVWENGDCTGRYEYFGPGQSDSASTFLYRGISRW